MALTVIEGKGTTIHSGTQYYIWDTVNRYYVNAAGTPRSGHASDIAFPSREEAEAAVDALTPTAEREDWEMSR